MDNSGNGGDGLGVGDDINMSLFLLNMLEKLLFYHSSLLIDSLSE